MLNGGARMIYFAAPLFNERERQFNAVMTSKMEVYVPVFLPQRDGTLLVDMLAAGVTLAVAERRVFLQDCAAMRNAKVLVAILDGAHVDEGVAFEIGFMAAAGKVCVALQSDVRRTLPTGNNPMIGCAFSKVFSAEDDLINWVHEQSVRWRLEEDVRKVS